MDGIEEVGIQFVIIYFSFLNMCLNVLLVPKLVEVLLKTVQCTHLELLVHP